MIFKNHQKNKFGFSLIELLITVGVLTMMMSVVSSYNHVGEKQIVLMRDQANLIEVFQRAKSLGLSSYNVQGEAIACGYGVHIEMPNTFLIFKDLANDCDSADGIFTGDLTKECGASGNLECVEKHTLQKGVNFDTTLPNSVFRDMTFIPPNPTIKLNPDASEITIRITDEKSKFSKSLKVNNMGQITGI